MIQTHFVSWNQIRNVTLSGVIADCAAKCTMTDSESIRDVSDDRTWKRIHFLYHWSHNIVRPTNHTHPQPVDTMMKIIASFALFATSAVAFNAFAPKKAAPKFAKPSFTVDNIPGALPPVGIWDPLGFADKADEATLKRYREAELTHGRVAMLATIGFLVGEAVEGSSFLFDASIQGPAITHLAQVPAEFWALLTVFIGGSEQKRAEIGWVNPAEVPVSQPGLLREDYYPGDIGFDPLGLKPTDPEELRILQTKELQNGRLAMLAAAGFIAQELADGKGILEHFSA
jgi:Chlorophyll A-B binding protein